MKNNLLALLLLFSTFSFSQTKKAQLELISNELDSLNQVVLSQKNIFARAINELNEKIDSLEIQLKTWKSDLAECLDEVQANTKKLETMRNILAVKNDSIKVLSSYRKKNYVILDSIKIITGEHLGETVIFERLSIPSDPSLEKIVNQKIFTLHNLNLNGYQCDPIYGFDPYINNAPLFFNQINNKDINYFVTYDLLTKSNGQISFVMHDQNANLICYDISLLDQPTDTGDFYSFYFNRRYLDDPEREH